MKRNRETVFQALLSILAVHAVRWVRYVDNSMLTLNLDGLKNGGRKVRHTITR